MSPTTVCLWLLLAGLLLRVDCFWQNRSLRGDEAAYFVCNVSRTPADILFNKNVNFYSPTAPLGYSFLEKIVTGVLGYDEKALRSISFACGILSVFFFYFLLTRYSGGWAAACAMGLFVFSSRLIFFSADMKPYAMDVFLTVFLIWLFDQDIWGFMAVSVFAVWLSYPIVFVLTALAIASLLRPAGGRLASHVPWIISFVVAYGYSIYPIIKTGITPWMWEYYFWHDPRDLFHWVVVNCRDIVKAPLGISIPVLGVVLIGLGGWSLFRRERRIFLLFVLPIVITLAAAVCKKYPFTDRVVLFLVPCLLMVLAGGLQRFKGMALVLIAAVLLFNPVVETLSSVWSGWGDEEGRDAIIYLKDHMGNSDTLLMNVTARFTFGYYMGHFHIPMKGRWIGCIWDGFFPEHDGRLDSRCIVEQLEADRNGFLTQISKVNGQAPQRIYPGHWVESARPQQWLLLIEPSDALKNFLRICLSREGQVDELSFKKAYLYRLQKHLDKP